jgi:hypothetical protein
LASESWLPAPQAPDESGLRPWSPEGIDAAPDRLSYVVVEEIIEGSIGLSVGGWPEVDEQGRLRFREQAALVGIDSDLLEQQLAEHRRPADIARPLRIGDVFAVADVEIGRGPAEQELSISGWKPPIYDISAQARAAAKSALYAAVAPILEPEQARELDELVEDVQG